MADLDARLDARLDAAVTSVFAEISRTDTKAGVLLTSFSLPLAALVATVPGRSLPALSAALVGLGTLGLVAAMLVVLTVVRPRITGAPRGSYLYWAQCTPEAAVQDLVTPTDRVEHLIRLSKIARRKHAGLRLAGDVTAAALIALAAAPLTALL